MCTCVWEKDRGALIVKVRCPTCEAVYASDGAGFSKGYNEANLIAEELQTMARERLKAKGKL